MTIRDLSTIFDGAISIFIESADIKHLWMCLYEGDIDNLESNQNRRELLDSEILSIGEDTNMIFSDPYQGNQLIVRVSRESVIRLIS